MKKLFEKPELEMINLAEEKIMEGLGNGEIGESSEVIPD